MDARDLTRSLTLEALERVPDGAGGFAESWIALGTLWAAMDAGTGRDRGAATGPLGLVGWRITVRGAPMGAPSRPRAGQRFREGERIFAIRAVAEADLRGAWLTCFADEEVVL